MILKEFTDLSTMLNAVLENPTSSNFTTRVCLILMRSLPHSCAKALVVFGGSNHNMNIPEQCWERSLPVMRFQSCHGLTSAAQPHLFTSPQWDGGEN